MNRELMSKAIYTTSEAAQLCNLSREIIRRHVNAGRLKALRIPGSRKRRIPRESLLEFMRAQGLSTAALESARQPLPVEGFVMGPSDLILNSLEQEGHVTQQDEGRVSTGNILEEMPSDLLIELSPKIPGAQVRINHRHG